MTEVRDRCSQGPGLPSDVTVANWLGYWVSVVLPTANIASATRDSYEGLCSWYLVPRLGRIRLVKLTPADENHRPQFATGSAYLWRRIKRRDFARGD